MPDACCTTQRKRADQSGRVFPELPPSIGRLRLRAQAVAPHIERKDLAFGNARDHLVPRACVKAGRVSAQNRRRGACSLEYREADAVRFNKSRVRHTTRGTTYGSR